MSGVEILNTIIIYDTILPEYWVGMGLINATLFATGAILLFIYDRRFWGFMCVILVFGYGILGCLGGTHSKTDVNYIEYKVTVDNSVSFNEFLNKYEIIDQEGKIYTVREKNKIN